MENQEGDAPNPREPDRAETPTTEVTHSEHTGLRRIVRLPWLRFLALLVVLSAGSFGLLFLPEGSLLKEVDFWFLLAVWLVLLAALPVRIAREVWGKVGCMQFIRGALTLGAMLTIVVLLAVWVSSPRMELSLRLPLQQDIRRGTAIYVKVKSAGLRERRADGSIVNLTEYEEPLAVGTALGADSLGALVRWQPYVVGKLDVANEPETRMTWQELLDGNYYIADEEGSLTRLHRWLYIALH